MVSVHFLEEAYGPNGVITVDHLTAALKISRAELAATSGLHCASVGEKTEFSDPVAHDKLCEFIRIINLATALVGTPLQAFEWYRSQRISSFGDQTAEALVKEGRAEAVKFYLERILIGGFA